MSKKCCTFEYAEYTLKQDFLDIQCKQMPSIDQNTSFVKNVIDTSCAARNQYGDTEIPGSVYIYIRGKTKMLVNFKMSCTLLTFVSLPATASFLFFSSGTENNGKAVGCPSVHLLNMLTD